MADKPHSVEWIDDSRLEWWSTEQLASILQRNQIKGSNKILDVGVGAGHWSAKLGLALAHPQDVTGIDFESHWVERSQAFFAAQFPQHTYQAVQAMSDKLPFDNSIFDIVTCQTVLMHCADPLAVLLEMKRVLKPDGVLLLAEPMNHWNRFGTPMLLAGESRVAQLSWKIWSAFRQQRIKEGQGDNDIAATLPSLLRDGVIKLDGVYQNETVTLEAVAALNANDYFAEYDDSRIVALLQRAGIEASDIDEAKTAMAQLIETFKVQGLTMLVSPQPLLLFVARKTA